MWSSTGTGTSQPNANFPRPSTYTPSAADIAAGFVLLRLTSADPAGPCGTVSDEVRLAFHEETPLSCNDLVNVSLDADCVSEVNPDDVLEGDADDYKFYILALYTNTNVPLPGGNVVGVADLGKTYKVKVTDICNNNYCWGNIKVEGQTGSQTDLCRRDADLRDHRLHAGLYHQHTGHCGGHTYGSRAAPPRR